MGGSLIFYLLLLFFFFSSYLIQKINKEPDVNPPIFQIFMTNQSEIVMFGQVEPVAGLCFAVKGLTGLIFYWSRSAVKITTKTLHNCKIILSCNYLS